MKMMTQRFIMIAALVVGVVMTVSLAGAVYGQVVDSKTPRHDPDVDLPFAEREAKYAAERDGFTKRLAAWAASFDPASVDIATLKHSELWALTDESKPSLDEAVATADRIVIGRAKELHPDLSNMFGTDVAIEVERTLKGKSESQVTVAQASTFYPTPDWKGVMILDTLGEPLMMPGNRYLLLLQDVPDANPVVQFFSGYYELKGGTVKALDLNAFKGEADGMIESAFLVKVDTALRHSGAQ